MRIFAAAQLNDDNSNWDVLCIEHSLGISSVYIVSSSQTERGADHLGRARRGDQQHGPRMRGWVLRPKKELGWMSWAGDPSGPR